MRSWLSQLQERNINKQAFPQGQGEEAIGMEQDPLSIAVPSLLMNTTGRTAIGV